MQSTSFVERDFLSSPSLHAISCDEALITPPVPCRLGYHNQICIDFSTTVVKIMSAKASEGISWLHGDVRNLVEVPDNSIDVAFDKGTLDAMIYGSPWDPPDEVKENTALYMNEVHQSYVAFKWTATDNDSLQVYRVLKKDGVFLYITFRQPHFIKPVVNANNLWQLETEVLGDDDAGFDYYAYVMVKRMTG